jgi:single-strand DNA-binding protein
MCTPPEASATIKHMEETMNSLNSILVEGNLTRDPELKATPKGTSVCSFSVASNRFYKQDQEYQKEVSFFDVETWAKLAESCAEYLEKGRGVRVVGRLKQDRWQDQEGNPRSKVKIVAEHVEFKPVFTKKDDAESDEAEETVSEEEEKVLETV